MVSKKAAVAASAGTAAVAVGVKAAAVTKPGKPSKKRAAPPPPPPAPVVVVKPKRAAPAPASVEDCLPNPAIKRMSVQAALVNVRKTFYPPMRDLAVQLLRGLLPRAIARMQHRRQTTVNSSDLAEAARFMGMRVYFEGHETRARPPAPATAASAAP